MSTCKISLIEGHAYEVEDSKFPNIYIKGHLYRVTGEGKLREDNSCTVIKDLGIYLSPAVLKLIDNWYFNNIENL